MSYDLAGTSTTELLKLHSEIMEALRARGILRSSNGPAGDYGEHLFSEAFGWVLQKNSATGYDAIDSGCVRYQIKCRRISDHNKSRQLSSLRRLELKPFDVLAGLLFDHEYRVLKAALIPIEVVARLGTFSSHVNAHRFILRDSVWQDPQVKDVTSELVAVQRNL